jgi:hypothetical protein
MQRRPRKSDISKNPTSALMIHCVRIGVGVIGLPPEKWSSLK